MEALQRQQAARLAQGVGPLAPPRPLPPPRLPLPGPRTLQAPEGTLGEVGAEEQEDAEEDEEEEEDGTEDEAAEDSRPRTQGPSSPSSQPPGPQPHEWTYEEQFKQDVRTEAETWREMVERLRIETGRERQTPGDGQETRRDAQNMEVSRQIGAVRARCRPQEEGFLDDLFSFMQKRGTPVNRVPIMAKQVLDLYALFRLVTAKGGLVEVINRKVWREVTRGLSLPTTITSAAFTLRTQYMKYLYPYECETRALSSPGKLQAAIDSNRREGRRQAYTTSQFFGLAGPPPRGTPGPALGPGSAPTAPQPCPRPAQGSASGLPAHACAQLTPSPIKKEERLDGPFSLTGSGISSINMALEINGVVYTGVLFARHQPVPASQGPTNPAAPPTTRPPSSTSP
ncbi:hypothetical protein MC885_008432 [Smutsia gigantea]|nr:hypothetical protein MC885_008432 [Smutsia gigantea]